MKNIEFLKDLAKLLEMDVSEISTSLPLANCMAWSSLAKVLTLGLISQHFGKNANIGLVLEAKTIGDLLKKIKDL